MSQMYGRESEPERTSSKRGAGQASESDPPPEVVEFCRLLSLVIRRSRACSGPEGSGTSRSEAYQLDDDDGREA